MIARALPGRLTDGNKLGEMWVMPGRATAMREKSSEAEWKSHSFEWLKRPTHILLSEKTMVMVG